MLTPAPAPPALLRPAYILVPGYDAEMEETTAAVWLETVCLACGGLPSPTCACRGLGVVPTAAGRAVLEFVARWSAPEPPTEGER